MNRLFRSLLACALTLSATLASAAPTYLITRNDTNVQSNAYIDGTHPSQYPTPAKKERKVAWPLVKMACPRAECRALIKMATDTNNPVDLCWVVLNMDSGEIRIERSNSANGYTLLVEGPGRVALLKN